VRAPDERFLARPDRAVQLGIVLLALFVVLAFVVPAHPLGIERRWAEWMEDIRTPFLDHVALTFNAAGRGLGRALSLVAIGLALAASRRWLGLLAFALTETLVPLISNVTKVLVDRPRPPGGLIHPAGAAFPSGHAAYAGATCVALVLLFTSPGPRRRAWWALAALGIVGMAWSRTYLQVHWLLDVLGGALLGISVCLLVFALSQMAVARRRAASAGRRSTRGG
jgi:undecaprenyl-diphosphatase